MIGQNITKEGANSVLYSHMIISMIAVVIAMKSAMLFLYCLQAFLLSFHFKCSVEFRKSWENMVSSSEMYRKVSNIRRTSVGNKIVDHSDVVGTSPVGAAPTTSSFST